MNQINNMIMLAILNHIAVNVSYTIHYRMIEISMCYHIGGVGETIFQLNNSFMFTP